MGTADATSWHRLLEKSSLVRRVSFHPLQIRWQSEGLATTCRAIPPWLYSATRSLWRRISDIIDCYSVIIIKFLFVYLPLRDVIVIYRFYPCLCLRRSINWLLKTVIVHTDLVFTFCMIACVTVPGVQKVESSGSWGWVLSKTTITPQACPFLFNFAKNSQNTYSITLLILMVELNV